MKAEIILTNKEDFKDIIKALIQDEIKTITREEFRKAIKPEAERLIRNEVKENFKWFFSEKFLNWWTSEEGESVIRQYVFERIENRVNVLFEKEKPKKWYQKFKKRQK